MSSFRSARARMTTARLVPVTVEMDGDELDAEDAWHLARRFGLRRIAVDSFRRFRYGDGFTNSRALALQTCLAVLPFLLALTGLAADIDDEKPARVVARHRGYLPGTATGDALASAASPGGRERRRARAGAGTAAGTRLDDGRHGSGRARKQPDLRDPTGPEGAREVRPGRRADRGAGRPGRSGFPAAGGRRHVRRRRWPSSTAGPKTSAGLADRSLAGRGRPAGARDRGGPRPRAAAAAARPFLAGTRRRSGGGAQHVRGRFAGGVRPPEPLVRQHLRPARGDRRPAAVVADDVGLAVLRRGRLRAARGPAGGRPRTGRSGPGTPRAAG